MALENRMGVIGRGAAVQIAGTAPDIIMNAVDRGRRRRRRQNCADLDGKVAAGLSVCDNTEIMRPLTQCFFRREGPLSAGISLSRTHQVDETVIDLDNRVGAGGAVEGRMSVVSLGGKNRAAGKGPLLGADMIVERIDARSLRTGLAHQKTRIDRCFFR